MYISICIASLIIQTCQKEAWGLLSKKDRTMSDRESGDESQQAQGRDG